MRVMVLVKATTTSEAGMDLNDPATQATMAEMGAFNAKLIEAGILEDAAGLKPSSEGKRLEFVDGKGGRVVDGPFENPYDLVAGYWIWTVKDMDEALAWAKQCPDPMPGDHATLEIRPMFCEEDFQ